MLAHWEDVTEVRFDVGPMGGGWRRLARAAGAVGVGCNRIEAVDHRNGER